MKYKNDLHPTLRYLLDILDAFTQLFFGVEITITSAYRPKGKKPSFHPKWQAADLRTKDLPPLVVTVWGMIISLVNRLIKSFSQIKGHFDGVFEPTKRDKDGKIIRGEHFHIEYDTGDPI